MDGLFKINGFPYDKGYHYNMNKTGEIIKPIAHINLDDISSIKPFVGTLLLEGKVGSKVIMKTKETYLDVRDIEVLNRHMETPALAKEFNKNFN
jgi:hypothetical protein